MKVDPSSAGFFELKYQGAEDPWGFRSRSYELARYEQVVRWIDGQNFSGAYEPGCSIGELTARLAERCEHVDAIEISVTAAAQARDRCARFGHVDVRVADWRVVNPRGPVDLIVLSELGYYCSVSELEGILGRIHARAQPGATLLACHWLGESDDHRIHGDEVHGTIASTPGWYSVRSADFEGPYRLEQFVARRA